MQSGTALQEMLIEATLNQMNFGLIFAYFCAMFGE
jgi:hypothetical protein